MNRIDYSHLGGLPVTQEHLDFLQQAFLKPFEGLAGLFGDTVIVSGCVVSGSVVSNGWVVVAGELLPFIGGSLGTEVVVVETVNTELYEDGVTRDVYFDRHATFGTPGVALWANFKRLSTIKSLTEAAFKPGMITMWSGSIGNIPEGWALCDGTSGTPNLSGRFIVGVNVGDPDFGAIGNVGGSKTKSLGVANLPPHTHTINGSNVTSFGGGGAVPAVSVGGAEAAGSTGTNSSGTSQAFDVLNPYYTLAYIIKL